jgi:hypothetical protein
MYWKRCFARSTQWVERVFVVRVFVMKECAVMEVDEPSLESIARANYQGQQPKGKQGLAPTPRRTEVASESMRANKSGNDGPGAIYKGITRSPASYLASRVTQSASFDIAEMELPDLRTTLSNCLCDSLSRLRSVRTSTLFLKSIELRKYACLRVFIC